MANHASTRTTQIYDRRRLAFGHRPRGRLTALTWGTMHGRNCSGFSTLASGRWHGKVCANFSHIGKKLRIQTGIHTYGYARVSTLDQDLTVQRRALRAAGCT
jgi:hypothetical protein